MHLADPQDRLSRVNVAWMAAGAVLAVGLCGFISLSFFKSIPFGIVFAGSTVCLVLFAVTDRLYSNWLAREWERLIRRPTWSAASGGSSIALHLGHPSVFRAEGRRGGRFPAQGATVVIGFDEAAFVVFANGSLLSRIRRLVIERGEPAEFGVVLNGNDVNLTERSRGLDLRILASRGAASGVAQYFGVDGGSASVADQLTSAMRASGWL